MRPRPSTGIAPAACIFALDPPSPRTGARARKLRPVCNACPKSRGDRGSVRWRALAGVGKLPTRIRAAIDGTLTHACSACDGCKNSNKRHFYPREQCNRAKRIPRWPNAIPMLRGTKSDTCKTRPRYHAPRCADSSQSHTSGSRRWCIFGSIRGREIRTTFM